jgi:hypothetical protein
VFFFFFASWAGAFALAMISTLVFRRAVVVGVVGVTLIGAALAFATVQRVGTCADCQWIFGTGVPSYALAGAIAAAAGWLMGAAVGSFVRRIGRPT